METKRIMVCLFSALVGWRNRDRAKEKSHISRRLAMKTGRWSLLTSILAVAIPVALSAAASKDVNVSDSLGKKDVGNEAEVSIDVNPTNAKAQVIIGHGPDKFETMNTFFSVSSGRRWFPVSFGDIKDGLDSNCRFDPTVAYDDGGNVYIAYGANLEGATCDRTDVEVAVVVARSTDKGQTYKQLTIVDSTAGNDHWQLATGPDPDDPTRQNVYITFIKNGKIVIFRSDDRGKAFTEFPVSDTARNVSAPSIAVGPEGNVYVAWLRRDPAADKIVVDHARGDRNMGRDRNMGFGTDVEVTSLNARQQLPAPPPLFPPQPGRRLIIKPSIDTDRSGGKFNGRVYVAYNDLGGGFPNTDIFVRRSDEKGAAGSWSAPVRVNQDGVERTQFHPWLNVDQKTGAVGVVWYDAQHDADDKKVEVFLGVSTDEGENFPTNLQVSDAQSDQSGNQFRDLNFLEYIGVAMSNCKAFVVWADNSKDVNDLDFFTDQALDLPCPFHLVGTAQFGLRDKTAPRRNKLVQVGEFTLHEVQDLDPVREAVKIELSNRECGGVFSRLSFERGRFKPFTSGAFFRGAVVDEVTRGKVQVQVRIYRLEGKKFRLALNVGDANYACLDGTDNRMVVTSLTVGDDIVSGPGCFARLRSGDLYFPVSEAVCR